MAGLFDTIDNLETPLMARSEPNRQEPFGLIDFSPASFQMHFVTCWFYVFFYYQPFLVYPLFPLSADPE